MGVALMALFLPNALAVNPAGLPTAMLSKLVRKTDPVVNAAAIHGLENTSNQDRTDDISDRTAHAQGDGALLVQHKVFYLRRVSAYNALPDQTNGDPDISACGPTRPNQVALSQDLFIRKNGGNRCGEQIDIILASGRVIHGVVWDTMSPRYHMAADILMGSVQRALDFGVKTARMRFVHSQIPATSGA